MKKEPKNESVDATTLMVVRTCVCSAESPAIMATQNDTIEWNGRNAGLINVVDACETAEGDSGVAQQRNLN